MPTNLYGPNDNYHPTHSHVLPALIRRFHEAKMEQKAYVTCWGDGSPLREFLYVDDLANLCVFLMNTYSGDETVNAGTGKELTHQGADRAGGKGGRLHRRNPVGYQQAQWNAPQAFGCVEGHEPRLDVPDGAGGRDQDGL